MKIKVKALYKFTVKFGKWDGFLLWLKFYAQKYNDLKVPNLKHSLFLRANTSDIPAFLDVFLKDEYKIIFLLIFIFNNFISKKIK